MALQPLFIRGWKQLSAYTKRERDMEGLQTGDIRGNYQGRQKIWSLYDNS